MDFKGLVAKNRSYRRFDESRRVASEDLRDLVELARMTPSARNLQPLRFLLVTEADKCSEVFSTLGWAGYLPKWPGPAEGERPTGYVVICLDEKLTGDDMGDLGIVAQTMMLGAVDKGYGGCMLGNVNKDRLSAMLDISANMKIMLVLALGVPAENVTIKELPEDGSIKYWRDNNENHYVPKRATEDLIVAEFTESE